MGQLFELSCWSNMPQGFGRVRTPNEKNIIELWPFLAVIDTIAEYFSARFARVITG